MNSIDKQVKILDGFKRGREEPRTNDQISQLVHCTQLLVLLAHVEARNAPTKIPGTDLVCHLELDARLP